MLPYIFRHKDYKGLGSEGSLFQDIYVLEIGKQQVGAINSLDQSLCGVI